MMELSDYVKKKMKAEGRQRYKQKLRACGMQKDPYLIPEEAWTTEPVDIPTIRQCDLYIYFIHTPSPHTKTETKAFKSCLGADSFVEAGWVQALKLHKYSKEGKDRFVISARVRHSQAVRATLTSLWFIAEKSGEILAAHCDCMAGLGESCSHIACAMSAVARAVHTRQQTGADSCTAQKCSWLPPSTQEVCAAPVCDIVFKSPSTKRKLSMNQAPAPVSTPQRRKLEPIPPPSEVELQTFYATLNESDPKPALLRVIDGYAENFVPMSRNPKYPRSLSYLYDPKTLEYTYLQLLEECERMYNSVQLTDQQIMIVEEETRQQSLCPLWFDQRVGRVTASIFKAACRTNPAMPSQSLIKRVCYPQAFRFSSAATRYGCEHEDDARRDYIKMRDYNQDSRGHHEFTCKEGGLQLKKDCPFIGASPDGIINCSCCGRGLLEIKCPYTYCNKDLPVSEHDGEDEDLKGFCMDRDDDGILTLRKDHVYYYQVQAQMNICGTTYCDFVVWNGKGEPLIRRIYRDQAFFNECVDKIVNFIKCGVLPELIGKWLTRRVYANEDGVVTVEEEEESPALEDEETDEQGKLYCYCAMPADESMLTCQNKKCTILKFHMECLRVRCPPKGKWYCPHCRRLPQFNRSKKAKVGGK